MLSLFTSTKYGWTFHRGFLRDFHRVSEAKPMDQPCGWVAVAGHDESCQENRLRQPLDVRLRATPEARMVPSG